MRRPVLVKPTWRLLALFAPASIRTLAVHT
jgi:hypothetical protein